MKSNKNTGRVVGGLFLSIFVIGIIIFQFLQGPILFSDDFLTSTSDGSQKIVLSVLLGVLSGIVSIVIATILFPIFKKYSVFLAMLYVAFSILNFIALSIDNFSVLSMLEVSQMYVDGAAGNANVLETIGAISYEKHWWTHYLSLLISCFPVFVLYYLLFASRLVPKIISIVGLIAVTLMFIEILFSILGNSISMNMMIPIGLIQLALPIWLLAMGLDSPELEGGS